MASKALVGILIGCVVIAFIAAAVIIGGGWYVKHKVEQKIHEATKPTVADLWSDVPKMDGLQKSDIDLPIPMKLLAQPILDRTLGGGTHKGDWIVFTTKKSPEDVKKFYTNDRMTSYGHWDPSKNSTCMDGSSQGFTEVGLFCVFEKTETTKQTGLMILTGRGKTSEPMSVFFFRVEGPPNNQPAPAPAPAPEQQPKEITALNGEAPYGIEKRPMPSGLNLDELLPKQVGPYSRTLLEMSAQRGVQPTSIEIDGNSVYATYRNGAAEIFMEFAVSSSAKNAQATLDTAAGETSNQFPTDPKYGSIATEPSYLKVNNESGAFFAWTRGGYYYSANAKKGEAALDTFMQAFPY
jgi:hypothetical protein